MNDIPCLCLATRRAARTLTRTYEEHLRDGGLTPAQFGLLTLLAARGVLSQSELAEHLDLDQTTLSRNLRPMIAGKWIKASRSRQDKRQTLYTVTPLGESTRQAALPGWRRAQQHMQRKLGKDWQKTFALLQQLAAA